MIERPMLAGTVTVNDFEKVVWPVLASPKIDGIRCLIHPTLGPVSRTFKPIANRHIHRTLQRYAGVSYLDGEIAALNEEGVIDFNGTQSAVMTRSGTPRFRYYVFDSFDTPDNTFEERLRMAKIHCDAINVPEIKYLAHRWMKTPEEFMQYAEACMLDGFEGAMIRNPDGPYKNGRSTLNQGWLLKWKPWEDAEGTVIGFEELYHNDNVAEEDAFGNTKRSSHVAGKVGAGTLGALVLSTEWGTLKVGTGFDAATRQAIWNRNWEGLMIMAASGTDMGKCSDMGRKVTFKYQKHGMQDLPRFPVFKGFREEE